MDKNTKSAITSALWRTFILGIALLLWEVLAYLKIVDIFFFSKPSSIFLDFLCLFSTGFVLPHIWITLQATFSGLFLGSILGIIMAFLLGRFEITGKILDPIIVALYGIPKLALGPLFILWFGLGIKSKIFLSFIWVFFIMYFNAYGGFKNVEQRLVNSAVLMGATPFQVVTRVVLPSSVPWLITGLKSATGVALLGTIVGEYIGSAAGLGHGVQYAGNMFNTTRVFSTILVMTMVMIMLNEGINALEKMVLRWRPQVGY